MKVDNEQRDSSIVYLAQIRTAFEDLIKFEHNICARGLVQDVMNYFQEFSRQFPGFEEINPVPKNFKIFRDGSMGLLEIMKKQYYSGFYKDFVTLLNDWYEEACSKCFVTSHVLSSILEDKEKLVNIENSINSEKVVEFMDSLTRLTNIISSIDKRPSRHSEKCQRVLDSQKELETEIEEALAQAKALFHL